MRDRPYTLLSCALSIDGYLGAASPRRLALSNDADFDRVPSVEVAANASPLLILANKSAQAMPNVGCGMKW